MGVFNLLNYFEETYSKYRSKKFEYSIICGDGYIERFNGTLRIKVLNAE